jgi:dipeptidyl aminopeptidase/acylaminoacyl peptidase
MKPEDYLDAILSLPRLYTPKISLDGKWLAWTWTRMGPAADAFAVPTDGSRKPLRLTATHQDTFVVSWDPEGNSIVVAQDEDGNERYQLFRIFLDNPETLHPLTEPSPNFFLRGGEIHPNGQWLIYGANVDPATGMEIEPTYLYRHDLDRGIRKVLAQPQKPCYYQPTLNQQGTHILYTRKDLHPAGAQIWLVDIEGQDDHEILNFGAKVKTYASWFPDGRRVLVLSEAEKHRRLGVFDWITHHLDWLIDDPARNLEAAFVPPNGSQIVVVDVQQARIRSSILNPETGEETHLPQHPLNLIPMAPAERGTWVAKVYSSRQPDDLVLCSLTKPDPANFISLSRIWEQTQLAPGHFTQAEDFRWRAEDGLEIQGWLYRAGGSPKGSLIHIHGGPTSHSQDAIHSQIQFLASQGFNVLAPNYRGSTGFGLAFQEAIKEEGWGGKEQEDIRKGIEALISAGVAEPGKVGVTGVSYGGYSAWWAITHFPKEIVAASAPICGMTDLVVDYETTRPDLRPYSQEMMGGSPDEVPERYYQRSPIHFVGDIQAKLLIIQGLQDPNVTQENVRKVRDALEAQEIPYSIFVFEDEGHGIIRTKNLKILYQQLAKFFGEAFSTD